MRSRRPRHPAPLTLLLLPLLALPAITACDDEMLPLFELARSQHPETVVITPDESVGSVGAAWQLEAEARDRFGGVIAGAPVVWISTTPDVVTVDEDGWVEALEVGTGIVEAQVGTATGTATFAVVSGPAPPLRPGEPGRVGDLRTVDATGRSIRLSFTEVDGGTGQPAYYRVRYAPSALDPSWPDEYTTVTEGDCATPMKGEGIGQTRTCEVPWLAADTEYRFGVIAYRYDESGSRVFGQPSNVASGRTGTMGSLSGGIWIDRDELMRRPTTGAAWERLLEDANLNPGSADISNQDSDHDVYTLAAALVCVRTGARCSRARRGVLDAIGTEAGGRWLAVGRNLGAYVIAADLLGLRADGDPESAGTRVEEWMEGWLTRRLRNNNTTDMRRFGPFHAGANAAAQEGFAFAAVAAYLGDGKALERAWSGFRTFVCDPGTPDLENIDLIGAVRDGWAHDDLDPCAVAPAGARKLVPSGEPGAGGTYRIDGALIADMRRGGTYRWAPGYTQYPWVGLEGLVPAAVVLERAGYPAFQVADRAILRTHEYLWFLRDQTGERRWFNGIRAREAVQLVNWAYGTSYPVNEVVGLGRTVGYTDWTHPSR